MVVYFGVEPLGSGEVSVVEVVVAQPQAGLVGEFLVVGPEKGRPRYYAKSPTVQNVNTKLHQLCWGDQEMETAISCTECSQVAGLIQMTGRSSMNVVP